ncbi:MAG: aminotransferase class V-fold PLP-dependent enzyme [Flavobacteriales bacterium TMED288]|nr:threonine aldolase [Flavobacteriales bacterium]RPG53668.1 MAG: aminotransferase class V-fold PLP-dependent enzyme [Flavobacteriales bacterium TMED288]|tara:strand:+ start:2454 stop:3473 length:1020 start_codon:yes stop_codon:yes gene_type:complete
MIELRSDTFTIPSKNMLHFMINAKVGDDVWEEDLSVNDFQKKFSKIFSMESALFCASGTMSNQIAIKVHTQPGDEVICDYNSHIYQYEAGGPSFNSGVSLNLINGNNGKLNKNLIESSIKKSNIHYPKPTLVSLENTNNKAGGTCYDINDLREISKFCKKNNINLHLDGARLFNAIIATDTIPSDYGLIFDSISICFSKGLGAPIGSLLLGSETFIKKARRIRKIFGGGMRQVGYLAAACDFAFDNNFKYLNEDHRRAKKIESVLKDLKYVKEILPVETNIIIFKVSNVKKFISFMKKNNILCESISTSKVRFVTNLSFDDNMLEKLIKKLKFYSKFDI